ncbi:muscular LMNA-interacting protein isoform X3 [Eleginops maclovinus]|uniref:muscular LMNA-interacting protein isoform X3 n=1 Tax=Eleginops maclovinus TaxID=56733 RepID=UPI00307FF135
MDGLKNSLGKNFTVSHEKTTGETMSHREIFKVFIKDSMEGGAGNTIQQGTKLRPSLGHMSTSQTKASPSVSVPSENITNSVTASMETAVDKHGDISQRQYGGTFGLAETHKIKLRYKSLAAIPTNTLLMDQQAIDEQVEREESPCDRLSVGEIIDRGVEDTHAEMCSPAELRQQSEELYAVIDEILAFSIPPSKASQSSTTIVGLQNNSSFAKSLGRETKYASVCSLHPSTGVNRKQINPKKTKPGVIRPMTAIPRLTVEDEEEFHPNPFRPFGVKQNSTANKKMASMNLSDAGKDFYTTSNGQKRGPFSGCELQIKEPEIR